MQRHKPEVVLTRREQEIVQLAAEGRTTREIAAALFRSPKTIENHLQSVYRKLGVSNRVELVNAARALGLTPSPPMPASVPSNGSIATLQAMTRINARLASVSDGLYFGELVAALAEAAEVRFGGISEVDWENGDLRVVVMADNGALTEDVTYSRSNTPCGPALCDGEVWIGSGASESYPDAMLTEFGSEAFAGVALVDRVIGPIGTLWVAHDEPIESGDVPLGLLRLFAPRTASELAVQRMLDELHELRSVST